MLIVSPMAEQKAEGRMGNGLEGEFAAYPLVWSDEFDGAAGSPPDPGSGSRRPAVTGGETRNCSTTPTAPGNAALDGAGDLAAMVTRRRGPDVRPRIHLRAVDQQGPRCHSAMAWSRRGSRSRSARGIWPGFWMLGQDFDRRPDGRGAVRST